MNEDEKKALSLEAKLRDDYFKINEDMQEEQMDGEEEAEEVIEVKTEPPKGKKGQKSKLKYLIDMGLLVTFSLVFITGIIKFPGFLNALGTNSREVPMYEFSLIHDYAAVIMGFLILGHLLLNLKWLKNMTVKMAREVNKKKLAKRTFVLFIVIIILLLALNEPAISRFFFGPTDAVIIRGIGEFEYEPGKIETVRPDIFSEGHFSVFDTLVELNRTGKIDLNYHFDESMNTHVIDEINGKTGWWYEAYYDMGWPENNAFRMDHFPYKEKMHIEIIREDESELSRIYSTFTNEMQRLNQNNGKIIIPQVTIRGTKNEHVFQDVEVTPHNLRNNMFVNDTITAIDIIMSLGDRGLITYELEWYEDIGAAEVKNYFVDKINEDKSYDRCGFVYETGSYTFDGFRGNHIHIPSDIRVINSPEYGEWFWICI
jgi:hypothetical protein